VDQEVDGWVAAVVPWPGSLIDPVLCRDAIAAGHGAAVAGSFTVLPVERVPLTKQGKPDQVAILRLGRNAKCRELAGTG
jgi:fatty-acyl-CoA synthase